MLPDAPNLICLQTEERAGDKSGRVAAKVLVASLLRNMPVAEVKVLRAAAAMETGGLFKVEKAGVEEGYDGSRLENEGDSEAGRSGNRGPWEMASVWKVAEYPWVLYLRSGSIALRGVDHLLAGKADILWAALPGVPVTADRCGYYLGREERAPGYRVGHPKSRPWSEAASAAVWAVRGEYFAEVMAEWERISARETRTPGTRMIESAWNRLLLDTPLRVARFEKDEVQFPCLPGADFIKWKDAAILNVGDWQQDTQSKFLQAWFYGTYFADPTGLFLDIVEP